MRLTLNPDPYKPKGPAPAKSTPKGRPPAITPIGTGGGTFGPPWNMSIWVFALWSGMPQTIGRPAQKPKPTPKTVRQIASCMTGEVVGNFLGDEDQTFCTVATNAVAYVTIRYGVPAVLPGPGWFYIGAAVAWDGMQVGKAYLSCR
jgi:hypothetical protein